MIKITRYQISGNHLWYNLYRYDVIVGWFDKNDKIIG